MGQTKVKDQSADELLEEAEAQLKAQHEKEIAANKAVETPANAQNSDETRQAQKQEGKINGSRAVRARKARKNAHSKRYASARALVNADKLYTSAEALELVKKTSTTKFDGTIELHLRFLRKGKKGEEALRGTLQLPSGTPKVPKVVILTEELIEQINKTSAVPFDVAIASPAFMPQLAKIAKILGPLGKMPNPKLGTVTNDPEKVKKEYEKGKIEYRADAGNNMHIAIGKVSWENDKILANFNATIAIVPASKIVSITLSSTMGPGIRVAT